MDKPAPTEHDVRELMRERWSPRAYSSKPVTDAKLRLALEENTIFPAIRELLPPETQESIIVELRQRRRRDRPYRAAR